jgi:DNA polymerase II small subunit
MQIGEVDVLSYHGQSLQDFSTRIGVNQNDPATIMKSMLQRRHMAPIYGDSTPLAPEKKDYLLIERLPDIFVTGHIHTTAIDKYRGIVLINASTWQSQTDYQKMMDFSPDPAKVPIVNLKNSHVSLMDFSI